MKILSAAFVLFAATSAMADSQLPHQLEGIGIDQKIGAQMPKDLRFVNQDGASVRLGDYFDDGKPVMLVLAYFDCPMLCTTVLNGVIDGIRGQSFALGKEYRVLTISFDPHDDAKAA